MPAKRIEPAVKFEKVAEATERTPPALTVRLPVMVEVPKVLVPETERAVIVVVAKLVFPPTTVRSDCGVEVPMPNLAAVFVR